MTRRIVIASSNPGKLREFRHLLAPLGWDVVSQAELNVSSADEPHATFLENALAKARHAAAATGLPALADDSGICAAALNGAPGVLSARFAGEPSDDRRNNEELLRRLADESDRRAHYTCVLAAVRGVDDPEPLIADARWHGVVIDGPRGERRLRLRPAVPAARARQDRRRARPGREEPHQPPRPGDGRTRAQDGDGLDLSPADSAVPSPIDDQAGRRRTRARRRGADATGHAVAAGPCRRCRSTSTSRGACASARTATSTRTSRTPAVFPSAAYLDALAADIEAALPLDLGSSRHQRLHRRRHAEPDDGGGRGAAAVRRPGAAAAGSRLRDHDGGQPGHVRGRTICGLPRGRREPVVDRRAVVRAGQARRRWVASTTATQAESRRRARAAASSTTSIST